MWKPFSPTLLRSTLKVSSGFFLGTCAKIIRMRGVEKKVMVERSWTRVFHCERLSESDQASLWRFQALFHRLFFSTYRPWKVSMSEYFERNIVGLEWYSRSNALNRSVLYHLKARHGGVTNRRNKTLDESQYDRKHKLLTARASRKWRVQARFSAFHLSFLEFLFFPRPNFNNGYAAAGQKLAAQLATLLVEKQVFLQVSALK
jgi:hypothetical protein